MNTIRTKKNKKLDLPKKIKNAINHLVKNINENGSFLYRDNMNSKVKLKKKYNWLRHSGTIYALSTYISWSKDFTILHKLKKTAQYLINRSIRPLENDKSLFAVWSKKKHTGQKHQKIAKLGGSGLALVALLSLEKISPNFVSNELLESLGNFLCFMQKENGGFYSKYIPSQDGKSEKWTSLYYPGEASLGLVMLYEHTKNKKWLKHAVSTICYLHNKRKSKKIVEADHWALLATKKILPHIDKLDNSLCSRENLLDHSIKICKSILNGLIKEQRGNVPAGCYGMTSRTTPISTRLEGLLAAYTFLPKKSNKKLLRKIEKAAHLGVNVLINSIVERGKFKGAVPRSYFGTLINSNKIPNKVSYKRFTELRIDYNQHCISALIQYCDIFIPKLRINH